MQADVWQNQDSGEIVISFRGTEVARRFANNDERRGDGAADVLTLAGWLVGTPNPANLLFDQAQAAMQVIEQVAAQFQLDLEDPIDRTKLTLTGHSLAGALQDYKRAKLVGAPTYGKGLIQRVFPLAEPIGGAVRTTIAMYGTPNHKLLHGRGLVPDIYVPTPPERLYRETGSVNISDEARAFRRDLQLQQLRDEYPEDVLKVYANYPDTQLDVALSTLKDQLG